MEACLWVCVLLLAVADLSKASAVLSFSPLQELHGVPPHDNEYFKTEFLRCRDGSKRINKDRLNDNFCDCPDGTDEPGTSACPEGMFYCRNAGHTPIHLFSSRVNDGICDCCDGSDEYDGRVTCANSCWEAGKVAREKLMKKIALHQDGIGLRRKEIGQALQAFARDEAELEKLKNEEKVLNGLVQELKAHKEELELAEERERKEKKKKEISKKESENQTIEHEKGILPEATNETMWPDEASASNTLETAHTKVEQSESNSEVSFTDEEKDTESNSFNVEDGRDGGDVVRESSLIPGGEVTEERVPADNANELSREELGRLVASRWTGENGAGEETEVHQSKDENNEHYNSDADEDGQKYYGPETSVDDDYEDEDEYTQTSDNLEIDDGNISDMRSQYLPSWLDKIRKALRKALLSLNVFRPAVNASDAAHIREKYHDSSSKLSRVQSRISFLTRKLSHDYGPDKEFYLLYDSCFENKQNKYVYKVCLFKEAKQVEGHSTTNLGQWDKFEDFYRIMQFSNGDKCWNGPDRSLKVMLRCGLKNELTDVSEPSRCEYSAVLSTPLSCSEERLKDLEGKLEMMHGNGHVHEEL